MKTCGNCRHYYDAEKQCDIYMPLWAVNADPFSNFSNDDVRKMEPDTCADNCKVFYKRRKAN